MYYIFANKTPFLENAFEELLPYIVLNIEIIYRGSLFAGKKLFEIHFNIVNNFSTLSVILAW